MLYPLEGNHYKQHTLSKCGSGDFCSISLTAKEIHKLLGLSWMGDLSFHHHLFITDFSIFSHLLRYSFICISISSVQFSLSVVSNSLRPHESQHTRPPCPSLDSCIFISYLGLRSNTTLLCCSSWPLGTHCIGYCVPLIDITDEFLSSTFLFSSTKRCSRLIL